jgi:hypothetical protein
VQSGLVLLEEPEHRTHCIGASTRDCRRKARAVKLSRGTYRMVWRTPRPAACTAGTARRSRVQASRAGSAAARDNAARIPVVRRTTGTSPTHRARERPSPNEDRWTWGKRAQPITDWTSTARVYRRPAASGTVLFGSEQTRLPPPRACPGRKSGNAR